MPNAEPKQKFNRNLTGSERDFTLRVIALLLYPDDIMSTGSSPARETRVDRSSRSPRTQGIGGARPTDDGVSVSTGIKKRTVKVRKIRRPDDISLGEPVDSPTSTPGAGPSRHHTTRSRSRSPPRHPLSSSNTPSRPRPPSPPPRPRRSHLAPTRSAHPPLLPCRSVYSYTRLNHIEEGTYGVVFRARCNDTGQIFALKKLKLEEEKQGFPITSLREVMALMLAGEHKNVVGIREIVVGETLNQ